MIGGGSAVKSGTPPQKMSHRWGKLGCLKGGGTGPHIMGFWVGGERNDPPPNKMKRGGGRLGGGQWWKHGKIPPFPPPKLGEWRVVGSIHWGGGGGEGGVIWGGRGE